MTVKAILLFFLFVLISCVPFGAVAMELKYVDFLDQLVDLDSLPTLYDGVQCRQFSSSALRISISSPKYDPENDEYLNWNANKDVGQYIRIDEESGEAVMAEIEGPGCIYRVWSDEPTGKIRFYLDGDEKPTHEFDFNDLFTGEVEPFVRPFVWQRSIVLGGDSMASVCYLPIPFARSCKVTADEAHEQGYHIGYKTFPTHWLVETFHIPLTDAKKVKLKEVGEKLENCGTDPQPDDKARLRVVTKALTPGKEVTVFDLKGPATIKRLNLKLISDEPYATRNVLLKIYWDGSAKPAVWCPVGDFFGRAYGDKPYASLPMGMTDNGDYSLWRMPFRESARITLTNEGKKAGSKATCSVIFSDGDVPGNMGYFHAKWRREAASESSDYPILECKGKGKFVGVIQYVDDISGGKWTEGDEKVFVDDEKFPSSFGTGSGDYYGDSRDVSWFVNPFNGCPYDEGRRQVCYRWHLTDSIPFDAHFKMMIENCSSSSETPTERNSYCSMAFWYAVPGGEDFFEPINAMDRIPSPAVIVKDAIEMEDLYGEGETPAGVRILNDAAIRDTLSRGRAVEYEGSAGSTFPMTLTIPETGEYDIEFHTPEGEISGVYQILYKRKPVGDSVKLKKGRQTFTIRFPQEIKGTRKLILDYVLLIQS